MPKTGVLPFPAQWAARTTLPRPLERGLLRRAPAQPDPFLSKDPGAGQVGWHAGNFAAFFGRYLCVGLKLVQIVPYRGGNNSQLMLDLNNPFSDGHECVEVKLIRGEDAHAG